MKGERGEGGARPSRLFSSGNGVCSHQFFCHRPRISEVSTRERSIASHCRAALERAFWRAPPPLGTGRAALIARAWRHRAPSLTAPCSGAREAHPLVKMETSEQEEQEIEMWKIRKVRAPAASASPLALARSRGGAEKKRSRTLFPPSPRPPYPLPPPRPAHPRPAAPPPPRTARQRPDGGSRQRHVDDQSRDPP